MVAFDEGGRRAHDDRIAAFTIVAGAPQDGHVVVGLGGYGGVSVFVVVALEAEVEVDVGWIEEFAGSGGDEVCQMEVFLFGVSLGVLVRCCLRWVVDFGISDLEMRRECCFGVFIVASGFAALSTGECVLITTSASCVGFVCVGLVGESDSPWSRGSTIEGTDICPWSVGRR